MDQFLFEFGRKINYQEDDYIVTDANLNAYSYIKNWGVDSNFSENFTNRFSRCLMIIGEEKSGKTHLASIWAKMSYAKFINPLQLNTDNLVELVNSRNNFVLDDLENFLQYQNEIFSFINLIVEKNKYILVTSKKNITKLNISLPDLKSRLSAFHNVEIERPDDILCKAILTKHFVDRQLRISIEIIEYILSRVDRDYLSLWNIVEIIDNKSLELKRSITIPFIKDILGW